MDACAQAAHADLVDADKRRTLISSARQEIDNRAFSLMMKVAQQFMESKQTPQEAVRALANEFRNYAAARRR